MHYKVAWNAYVCHLTIESESPSPLVCMHVRYSEPLNEENNSLQLICTHILNWSQLIEACAMIAARDNTCWLFNATASQVCAHAKVSEEQKVRCWPYPWQILAYAQAVRLCCLNSGQIIRSGGGWPIHHPPNVNPKTHFTDFKRSGWTCCMTSLERW